MASFTLGNTFPGMHIAGTLKPFSLNALNTSKFPFTCPEKLVLAPPALCLTNTWSINLLFRWFFSKNRKSKSKSDAIFRLSLKYPSLR